MSVVLTIDQRPSASQAPAAGGAGSKACRPGHKDWRHDIRDRAKTLGFDQVGFAAPDLPPRIEAGYRRFVDEGHNGDMDWLATTFERRVRPSNLWPDVKSIIVLGMNYGPDDDPLSTLGDPGVGTISVYASHRDYHDLVKGRLKQLGQWLVHSHGGEIKVFVDTAPVLEKPIAEQAGLGWQGKHSNLVSRSMGSWIFLGEIFTSLDLPPDPAASDHCGSCRACLDICPTSAFPAPYRLDARRCISYLTIEHKGHIPLEFRQAMGNRIYGCDDCLAVCPWNKFASSAREAKLRARDDLKAPPLADLVALDDAAFRRMFSGSPIKRIGRDRFVRNVLIAIGNSGSNELVDAARRRLTDASPLVRAMALWALGRLLDRRAFASVARACLERETDAAVRREAALS